MSCSMRLGVAECRPMRFLCWVETHDLQHLDRAAVLVAQGDLALGVGLQHGALAGVAHLGQPLAGCRGEYCRVAGISCGVSSQA